MEQRKYYKVTIKNLNSKDNNFQDSLVVIADYYNGLLEDILTSKRIFVSEDFDLELFLNSGADLYGNYMEEIKQEDVAHKLEFITTDYVRKQVSRINTLTELTKMEVKKSQSDTNISKIKKLN